MGATAWLGLRAAASHYHPDLALALVKGEGLAEVTQRVRCDARGVDLIKRVCLTCTGEESVHSY